MKPRTHRRHKTGRTLPEEHYQDLRTHIESRLADPDCLTLAIIARTGARVCEVFKLRREHIDLAAGRIFVSAAKDSSDRWMPMHRPILEELARRLRPEVEICQYARSIYGRDISDSSGIRMVRAAFADVNLNLWGMDLYSLHGLRHNFAMRFLKVCPDVYKLQIAMGHRDLKSTARYLRFYTSENVHEEIIKAVG